METKTSSSSSRVRLAAVVCFLFIVAFLWPGFDVPIVEMDEGMVLAYPEQITNGKLPYRDFESYYTPGNIYILAGCYEVFGATVTVERTVGLLYRLAVLAALFAVGLRRSVTVAVGAALIGALIIKVTNLAAFAWWGGIAAAAWALVVLSSDTRHRATAAGLLSGLALFYRQDLGPAVILGSLPLWLLLDRRDRWLYIGAIGVALLPLLAITVVAGWQATFENLFTYPVLIANAGRRLPISGSNPALIALLWVHFGALVCALVAGILQARESRSDRLPLAMALFALAITPQAVQRFDSIHLAFAAFGSLALLPGSLSYLAGKVGIARSQSVLDAAALASVAAMMAAAIAPDGAMRNVYRLSTGIYSLPVDVNGRSLPMGNPMRIREVFLIGRLLEQYSTAGERLFVGPGDLRRTAASDVYLYYLLPWLQPASYFMEMNPFSANRVDSRLVSDLETADWLILNRMYDYWDEPNASTINGPDKPNLVVQSSFIQRAEIGPFRLFERRGKPSKWRSGGLPVQSDVVPVVDHIIAP